MQMSSIKPEYSSPSLLESNFRVLNQNLLQSPIAFSFLKSILLRNQHFGFETIYVRSISLMVDIWTYQKHRESSACRQSISIRPPSQASFFISLADEIRSQPLRFRAADQTSIQIDPVQRNRSVKHPLGAHRRQLLYCENHHTIRLLGGAKGHR